MKNEQLTERMGFTDSVPFELVDRIWREYLKTTFANRRPKYSTSFTVDTEQFEGFPEQMTFVVEKGYEDEDYYKAALFNDGSIHLNADALGELSDEEAKSSVEHELVHVLQYEKERTGERGVGEFGYNKAVNQGLIDEKERRSSLWMMEQLQEKEIEARLSQLYKYVKNSMRGITPQGSMSDYVMMIVESCEDITKLSDLETAIKRVQDICDGTYLYYINLFVKDAQAALYGVKQGKKKLTLPEAKKEAAKLLKLYLKRLERYKRRVYNAVYQAVMDAQEKERLNEDEEKKSLRQRQEEAYEEAKTICLEYLKQFYDSKLDKRRGSFRRLQRNVIELWIGRMNNFGKILGLPTFYDYSKWFSEGKFQN